MRQGKEFQDLPKDPDYWYECEFSIPVAGGMPKSVVIDVLANDLEQAENIAMSTGPSGGILQNVFKRGTSALYRVESATWGQGEDFGLDERIELAQSEPPSPGLECEGYTQLRRGWNPFRKRG